VSLPAVASAAVASAAVTSAAVATATVNIAYSTAFLTAFSTAFSISRLHAIAASTVTSSASGTQPIAEHMLESILHHL
jgi:hypothetical protein